MIAPAMPREGSGIVAVEWSADTLTPVSAALRLRDRLAFILESVEGDRLRVVDEENRRIYNVRFGDIRAARLDFQWPGKSRAN